MSSTPDLEKVASDPISLPNNKPSNEPTFEELQAAAVVPEGTKKDWRFWMVFLSLCFSTLLSALDLTAVSTALPNIVKDLNGTQFTWVGSAYALSSTAFLPFGGVAADIFGRRPVMLASLLIFMLGSGIAGGSTNMNMMIAARTIQGIGGGGILVLTEIVVADLLPLSERAAYAGIIGAVWALASCIGPLIGGGLATNWKWLFYLNLPVGGVACILVLLFLNLKTPKEPWREGVKKLDFFGNFLIIGSTTGVILALVFGGSSYAWSDYKVLVPLIIGAVGTIGFFIWEFKFATRPAIPFDIVSHPNALAGYFAVFIHGIVSMIFIYYVPVYFQGVKEQSSLTSAISFFSMAFTIAPFAILCAISIQASQKYAPQGVVGWVLLTVGSGLWALLRADSSKAMWVGLQIPVGVALGILYTAPQFAILSTTKPQRNAAALSFLTFVRSYGQAWGVSIGSTIMQNGLQRYLPADFAAQFGGGGEVAYSVIAVISTLVEPLRTEVKVAFNSSLRLVWLSCVGICGLGLISVIFIRDLGLSSEQDEDWGIQRKEKDPQTVVEKGAQTP